METSVIIIIIFFIACAGISIFFYWRSIQFKRTLEQQKKETEQKMYELAILKELGDRVGYSLNVEKIVDVIIGSLHQFIEYSAVSYMLLTPEHVKFKAHLEESVSRQFINDIRDRMLKSLSALLNKKLTKEQVDETLSGAILVDELADKASSFFNIPLVIGEKVVGVLTIAHTQPGLYKEQEMTMLYKITQQASRAVTRLEDVVANEQYKLNTMVESMSEGVLMTDNDYRIIVANPRVKKIIGLQADVAATIFDFIDNLKNKFDIKIKLEESIKLKKNIVIDEVLINDHYYQIFISPVKSSDIDAEKILGGVVIFHDITHDKELEKMREDFTSMMVHELRSPLDGIKKMAKFMQKPGKIENPKEYLEYTSLIHESSANMLQLVNDLLDAAKIEAGKFEAETVPSDIKKLIKDKVDFYIPSATAEQIDLKANICSPPQDIDLDFVRIGQVINNLLSNALKFTSVSGKIEVGSFFHAKGKDINIEAKENNIFWYPADSQHLDLPNSVVVSVSDSGVGISPENITGLFNKFVQFQSSAKKQDQAGTGLGLVIAKGIVEAHNGIMGVSSIVDKGSTFYFTIPINN